MELAGLRLRRSRRIADAAAADAAKDADATKNEQPSTKDSTPADDRDGHGEIPPRFVIDLSQPPANRYSHVASALQATLGSTRDELIVVFDDLITDLCCTMYFPRLATALLHGLARLLLRRVYDAEEQAELQGLAAATGLPLYLLVAFNVVLDTLLGCTSGGVRTTTMAAARHRGKGRYSSTDSCLLHFRALDWGMDPLRRLVIELDFVRQPGGPVVASTMTYFGHVGVLTGVRRALSVSLNFRPHHDQTTWLRRLRFRYHQLLVLLGRRRSVTSLLRQCLFAPDPSLNLSLETPVNAPSIADWIHHQLPQVPCTSAYLVFCTPQKVYLVEKDNRQGLVLESSTFLAACNHDCADEVQSQQAEAAEAQSQPVQADEVHSQQQQNDDSDDSDDNDDSDSDGDDSDDLENIIASSMERKAHLTQAWDSAARPRASLAQPADDASRVLRFPDVVSLVSDAEISNEETHYAVIMDPGQGKIVWRQLFPKILDTEDEEDD